ncbi:MAG: adenylate/guanylate cyclase domain-containing protein [Armatimonadetes bacterium]|nr:adenylate/guanylate cyclase domain-containing protein [Armatimonadota bacterium]
MPEAVTQEREETGTDSSVDQFIAYLRAHPYKLNHPKEELAQRFGLSEEFVGDVLETLRGSPDRLSVFDAAGKALMISVQMAASYMKRLYLELTDRPVVTIAVTLVMTITMVFALRGAGVAGYLPVPASAVEQTLAWGMALLAGAMMLLHSLCYFRHGMIRYPVVGFLLVFSGLVPIMFLLNRDVAPSLSPQEIIIAATVFSVMYLSFSTIVSLLGAYWQTRQDEKSEQRMTRQELIDRLFELQGRLESFASPSNESRPVSLVSTLRAAPWLPLLAFAIGAFVGFAGMLVRAPFGSLAQVPEWIRPVLFILKTAAYLAVGYVSGGVRKSVVALMLVFVGIIGVEFIPYGFFGPQYIELVKTNGDLLLGLVGTIVVAIMIGLGAHIDERARRRRKLADRDPAVVLSEIVQIQWRLNQATGATCVMVVDVAGSRAMKSEADPLAVEYSFRAFQGFLADIAEVGSGTVLSTAGDGAVVTFPSCAEALYAAKEIQTEIVRFNSRTNRLPSPFRVRIGIHMGEVSAQLADVPFNELIDIAAHVEKEAPVGGIAMTKRVHDHMEDERVAAMKEEIDGQSVFFVLNPTLSA